MLLILALEVPFLQGALSRFVAGTLSEQLGTEVSVGRIEVGLFNRFVVNDLRVADRQHRPLLSCHKLAARLDMSSLARGPLIIRSVKLVDGRVHLRRDAPTAPYNFQFIIDSLSRGDGGPSRLDLQLRSLIVTNLTLTHDLAYRPRQACGLDPAHLHVEGLNTNISLKALRPDSLNLLMRNFKARERSGVEVRNVCFHLVAGRRSAGVHRLDVRLKESRLHAEHIAAHYQQGLAAGPWQLSVGRVEGFVVPAELGAWLGSRQALPRDGYRLNARVEATQSGVTLSRLNITRGEHLRLGGRARLALRGNRLVEVHLPAFHIAQDEAALWARTLLPAPAKALQVLAELDHMDGRLDLNHTPAATTARVALTTGAGRAELHAERRGRQFALRATSPDLEAGRLLGRTDVLGRLPFALQATGRLATATTLRPEQAHATLRIDGGELCHYAYRAIRAEGTYHAAGQTLAITAAVDDDNARLEAQATYHAAGGHLTAGGRVEHLDLPALGLARAPMNCVVAGRFELDGRRTAGLPEGTLHIADACLTKRGEDFRLHRLTARSETVGGQQRLGLDCDFMTAELRGRLSPRTLAADVFALLRRNTDGPGEQAAASGGNNFAFSMELRDSRFIEHILEKKLHLEGTARASGYMHPATGQLMLEAGVPQLEAGGQHYSDLSAYCKGDGHRLRLLAQGTRSMGSNGVRLVAQGHSEGQALQANLEWRNDHGPQYSGTLLARATFAPGRRTLVDVQPSTIVIDDSLWQVAPSHIDHRDGHVRIDNFKIYRGDRHLAVSGTLSPTRTDSLLVDVGRLRLEYVFDLLNFHPVDFGGEATGRALVVHPLSSPEAHARLDVRDFTFNGAQMGRALIRGSWDPAAGRVNLNATMADSTGRRTGVAGHVDVAAGGLDLRFNALHTDVDFLNSFLPDVLTDVSGTYRGNLRLYGPFSHMQMEGDGLAAVRLKVAPLNTYFAIAGDSIHFRPGHIVLPRVRLADMEGHAGTLSGEVWHDHLHDFRYRFDLTAQNLMVFDCTADGDRSFWGKVYATGTARLWGEPGAFNATAHVRPEAGSLFTYNADWNENTDESSAITFRDRAAAAEDTARTAATRSDEDEDDEAPTDVRLELNLDMHPDAGLNVVMDNRTGNALSLYGSGMIRASYYNKGDFGMYGTYTLDHGTYELVVQNVIRRPFVFGQGGRIVFGGDPTRADLDLQASYAIPSVSLADLNPGGALAGKNVRVNCLLNFTGTVGSPQVNFGLDVPNVSDEEKQMIRSLISTDEDLNMQVAYLLSVGRFYAYNTPGNAQQSQSASAMNSILSGALSAQVNSILSTALKNQHWSLGTNLQTGTDGWSDMEVEGLFSGRFLSGRLLLNGMFGYRDQQLYNQTNFIGDFSLEYLLNPRGTIRLKAYSEENDRYFTRTSLTTQGGGLRVQKDFNRLSDLFFWKKRKNRTTPPQQP